MKKKIVLTAIGEDRPGIVAAVTKTLFEKDCNLEDSSMTILEGEFAVMLVLSVPTDLSIETLNQDFDLVRKNMGLEVFLKELATNVPRHGIEGEMYMISVYGADQKGIVYHVAQLLADHNINITDVNTCIHEEDKTSSYMMMLEVVLPDVSKLTLLEDALKQLASELSVHITIHPIDTATL